MRVWDLPIRIWHWLFAAALTTAFVTGYFTELYATTTHAVSGMLAFALLVFRIAWGFCGGTYTRWNLYWTSPKQVLNHFLRRNQPRTHTAPGIALVVLLMIAALIQSSTGLFTTDGIFLEGPLTQYVEEEFSDSARWIHKKVYWVILALASTHVLAHFTYLLVLHNNLPLSMFHGRKVLEVAQTQNHPIRAVVCLCLATLVFLALFYNFD